MGKNTKRKRYVAPAGSLTERFSLSELLRPAEEAPIHAYSDLVSGDGRRAQRVPISVGAPLSPVKQNRRQRLSEATPTSHPLPVPTLLPTDDLAPEPSTRMLFDEDSYTMTLVLDTDDLQAPPAPAADSTPPSKTTSGSATAASIPEDSALHNWANQDRDKFLDLFLWLDGRGSRSQVMGCPRCLSADRPALARCCECSHARIVCVACCVAEHEDNPLHWIEVWNGQYFKRTSLKSIGLCIQLGHPLGERCSAPHSAGAEFVVVHTNGVSTTVGAISSATRITSSSSAVVGFPRLATGRIPDVAPYNYYKSLEYLTDSATINKPPDKYRVLLRMMREYRHILLLKRRGRGHDPTGVKGTASGELAIRCPSCPRPGVNLPENWNQAPPEDECLYILFVGLDACFRLKRRLVSSWKKGPGLGTGWSYFVEWEPYRDHLLTITDQKEVRRIYVRVLARFDPVLSR
uniref:CxC2-like cysteine cluster KDZ transposase-associated domain-containing protein n=1 Tax=Mycena chlorophos TaxID=658473 RepID=A0ABQ0M7R9_MYCCL|nr:predicted protein [Mycena chlorophos]